jgi:hypothetical protein
MIHAGTSQQRIARTLNVAYANGLLSHDTFVRRTDTLLSGGVIDPGAIVGDLAFRRESARLERFQAAISRMVSRVLGSAQARSAQEAPLLALDWSGTRTEVLVGRHESCDVVLSDITVSRCHARLRYRDGRWILHDLSSTNGTHVNGVSVGRCELRPGDHVALGEAYFTID